MDQPRAMYQALAARDPRFDGIFFVGVTSTGIYCRPICTARTPQERNCRFFTSAAQAEKARFRPCMRCRPELAPGNAPVDGALRLARLIVQRIEEGLVDDDSVGLDEIAAHFGLSARQIRRVVQKELGVSPIELILTRRLLLAKQLLTETRLPVTQVAFSSGFASLRRFNDAFSARYGMPPTRLRKEAADDGAVISPSDTSTLRLAYRPPYDWPGMLAFLAARTLEGAEHVTEDAYLRTVCLGKHRGWVRVTDAPEKNTLLVEFTHSLSPVLPALLGRLRNLFDLAARPDVIARTLMADERLRPMVKRNPGLRVPGAFDGFELAVRAILGQQVTVKAATTLAGRFAAAFGRQYATPLPELTRLSPTPRRVAAASIDDVAKLGIIRARAASIIALARAVESGELQLEPASDPERLIAQLVALPGIGPWTAHYIAMRALRWPDAFPKEDVAVLKNLGGISPREADAMSESWRPWRSYAVLHIWENRAPRSR